MSEWLKIFEKIENWWEDSCWLVNRTVNKPRWGREEKGRLNKKKEEYTGMQAGVGEAGRRGPENAVRIVSFLDSQQQHTEMHVLHTCLHLYSACVSSFLRVWKTCLVYTYTRLLRELPREMREKLVLLRLYDSFQVSRDACMLTSARGSRRFLFKPCNFKFWHSRTLQN